jgi:hypothetical protein
MFSRLSRPTRTQATALLGSAAGIIVQIIAGKNYPAVPPGLIILFAAAAIVLFVPWRWVSLIAVFASAFLFFGGFADAGARYDLTHTGQPGVFVGTWIEIAAIAVALVAGIAALIVGNRRPARSW